MENRFETPEESGGEQKLAEKNGTGKAKPSIWIVIAAATFLILALALGLGLGLGLKKSSAVGTSQNSNGTSSSPNATGPLVQNYPSWRRDPDEYLLDMGWDIDAAPTTRTFNLTLGEIQAAPDGMIPTKLSCIFEYC